MKYKLQIYTATIIFIGVIFVFYKGTLELSNNNEPMGISWISLGVGFLGVLAGIMALLASKESLIISKESKQISEESRKIADGSDNKMKAIANAHYLRTVGIFENERYRIRNTHPVSEAIWKSFTHAREANILKDWVDESHQGILIARFAEFLDELYQIKSRMHKVERTAVFNEERNNQLKTLYNVISELEIFPEYSLNFIQQLIYLDIEVDDAID